MRSTEATVSSCAAGRTVGSSSASAIPDAARPGGARLRAWLSSAQLQGLGALLIYAAIWILIFVPALVSQSGRPQLDQSSMDPNFFTWSLQWWPYAISHGLDPLQTNLIGAPAGINLAWLTTVPPLALIMWPVTAIFGPVVSFNLLVAVAPPLAGWAAFVLCRRLTRRFWPSLVGGAVYGFSAYEYNHSVPGHLNMTFSLLLPFMGYLVVLWRDGTLSRTAFTCWLTAALLLQLMLFLETFADLTAMWAVGLAVAYLLAAKPGRPVIAKLSRYVGVAYLVTFAITGSYLYYVLKHTPRGFANTTPQATSMNLASLVVPRPSQTLGLGWLHHYSLSLATRAGISESCYVGIPLLLLVVVVGARTWSSRITRFLVIMLVVAMLVALGPDLQIGTVHLTLPWAELWKLPVARSAFPNRAMVFGFLALAVIVARWLASPEWKPALRWLLGLLAVAGVLLDSTPFAVNSPSAGYALPRFISSGEYRHYLSRGETVIVVSRRGNAGLLWQAETDFYIRIAGGFVNQAISRKSDLPLAIQQLSDPDPASYRNAVAFMRHARVGAVLVEQNLPVHWIGSFYRLGMHGHLVSGVSILEFSHELATIRTT